MKKNKLIMMVVAVLAVAAAAFYGIHQSGKMEKARVALAEDAVNAISESWSPEVLKARADPGLIKAMASQGQSAEELLKVYSALGKPKQSAECKVHTTGTFMKGGKEHTTVSYECMCEYEKGPAAISITLNKAEDETDWLIYYLNIHSDVFGEIIE